MTARALQAIAAALGFTPSLQAADVAALGWDVVPADARLEALSRQAGGPVVCYLHARRGSWRAKVDGRAAFFLGVIEDALVFAGGDHAAVEALLPLLHHARASEVVSLATFDDGGLGAGLARAPELSPGGVCEWGPFPHAVPDGAARRLLGAAAEVSTAVLRAIPSAAGEPRELRLEHREP